MVFYLDPTPMNNQIEPIEMVRKLSSIVFPSCLFSLAKDEIFPYEYFAYTILEEGIISSTYDFSVFLIGG